MNIVSEIINKPEYTKFHESINRIIRIVQSEKCTGKINESLFSYDEEKQLYLAAKNINETELSYKELAGKLFAAAPLIQEFFDKVLVMDKNEQIKQNRLNLLHLLKNKFDKIADFSKITAPKA